MAEQREITSTVELLDEKGHLISPGWSRRPLWRYERDRIKASALRIKEWDYYYIFSQSNNCCITLTFSDLGYAGLMALCYLDFKRNEFEQADSLAVLPMGRFTSSAPGGDRKDEVLEYASKDLTLRLESSFKSGGQGERRLVFSAPAMDLPGGKRGLSGDIILTQPEDLESINIATSWQENRRRFYYNRKINCMPASGSFTAGDENCTLDGGADRGGLDWGRGAWTYRNRWFWSSASGVLDGKEFGFNLGYGFSDRTPASENTLFYEGRAHKLEDVQFHFDPDNYMKPWRFSESKGRLELDFTPGIDRASKTDFLLIKSVQHQVFGLFSGEVVLDDGKKLVLKDFPGFAEDVYNRW